MHWTHDPKGSDDQQKRWQNGQVTERYQGVILLIAHCSFFDAKSFSLKYCVQTKIDKVFNVRFLLNDLGIMFDLITLLTSVFLSVNS